MLTTHLSVEICDSEAPNMGVANKGGHQEQIKLVGGIPTPLKNMTSSVGMMKFPIYGKS